RHRDERSDDEAGEDGLQAGEDLVKEGGTAGVFAFRPFGLRIFGEQRSLPICLAGVESLLALAFGLVVAPEVLHLARDRARAGERTETDGDAIRRRRPQSEKDRDRDGRDANNPEKSANQDFETRGDWHGGGGGGGGCTHDEEVVMRGRVISPSDRW